MIDCEVWWATPVAADDEFLPLLTATELQRHHGYRLDIDRRRFLTGRALAKTQVARRLGCAPGEVAFDATCPDCDKQHGPPRVPGSGIQLSISHSGERIGLALTDGLDVGLDVEAATRRADDSLLDYALNEAERAALGSLDADARTDAFFTYWTRKEAVMKATGRGLRIPLKSLTLSPHDGPARLVASEEPALDPATTSMADLTPGEGYRAAVAVLTGERLSVTEQWWQPG